MTSTRPHKVHQKFKKNQESSKKVRKQVEPNHQHTINTQNGKSDGCGCEQLKNNTRDQTTKADNYLMREIQKESENKYNWHVSYYTEQENNASLINLQHMIWLYEDTSKAKTSVPLHRQTKRSNLNGPTTVVVLDFIWTFWRLYFPTR